VGERSELILEIVNDRRVVSYKELAGLLGVSTMTARRECERLSRGGKLVKTIGGVRGLNGEFGYGEKTMDERMGVNVIEKRAIAKKALKLIETPSVVFIDGSTTCVALARLIDAQCDGVTVVTHSLQVCLTIRSGRNSVQRIAATQQALGTSFFLFNSEDRTIAGDPVAETTNLTGNQVVYGRWSDLALCIWGDSVEITIDPYSSLSQYVINLHITLRCNSTAMRPVFCVSTDAGNQ
jgi:hypothetical protein